MSTDPIEIFEQARPALTGLAYRLLGSVAEAEDVVQDTFLKWREADPTAIDNPRGWLTTVCTRKALDVLRSARVARTSYTGPWLPEPLETHYAIEPEQDQGLSESVTTAFLLVLDRLGPKERAAFLLREVFDMDYALVADSLGVSEQSCRKLVSRARTHLRRDRPGPAPAAERQWQMVRAFEQAIASGDPTNFTGLLMEDVVLTTDGGGKVVASLKPQLGFGKVLHFLSKIVLPLWPVAGVSLTELNGGPALLVREEGVLTGAATFDFAADGRITAIYIMRNPEKLARLAEV